MFEKQIHCDVTFTFKTKDSRSSLRHGETGSSLRPNIISAHKYVLISRSPAFYAKFTGSDRDGASIMNVEDVDRAVFMKMLRYAFGYGKGSVIESAQIEIEIADRDSSLVLVSVH